MLGLVIILSLLAGCQKAPDTVDQTPAPQAISEKFDLAEGRVLSRFVENGWIVSRGTNGSPEHVGDSLIWTGVWLTAAGCEAGNVSEAMLQETIERNDGALVRYEPLGEYAGGREISADGAIGLYRGVAERLTRCPESAGRWLGILKLHKKFMEDHNGRLHGNSDAVLVPEFDYGLDLLLARLTAGPGSGFDDRRLARLVSESTAWALAVQVSHASAFRIHLALLAIETVETLGQAVNSKGRDGFCAAARDVDMPTVDHWCGRGDIKGWVDAFEYDHWEYRHQRSGAWESPDGNGLSTPGLDLLVGIRRAYFIGRWQ